MKYSENDMPLKKLNVDVPPSGADGRRLPDNGVGTPSREHIKEAVREANDPKRLISDPPTHSNYWPAK